MYALLLEHSLSFSIIEIVNSEGHRTAFSIKQACVWLNVCVKNMVIPLMNAFICENNCFTLFKSESIQTATLDILTPDYTMSITQTLLSRMELNSLRKSGK